MCACNIYTKHVIFCSQCDCILLLAGGEYMCYTCGRYSYRVCACSVAFYSVKKYTKCYIRCGIASTFLLFLVQKNHVVTESAACFGPCINTYWNTKECLTMSDPSLITIFALLIFPSTHFSVLNVLFLFVKCLDYFYTGITQRLRYMRPDYILCWCALRLPCAGRAARLGGSPLRM